ncbi:PQQ-binding-like beta-propeller repeat protein [uncultured Algibacter sp.]|uniref:outer membrane protein assembly factor BamB family protein n=1 Tax=uncultured Algibacter sp. TaxID=298659 RepID=UPI002625850C|nr:PQQ-binding-like beta-propeller repeat protein [uncultured Algibacter sp.]
MKTFKTTYFLIVFGAIIATSFILGCASGNETEIIMEENEENEENEEKVIKPVTEWEFTTGGPIWGSSTTKNNITYFGSTDGKVYALDSKTGAKKWEYKTNGPIHGNVSVYDNYLYIASDDGNLYKLSTASGIEIWKANINEEEADIRYAPADNSPNNFRWDYRGSSPTELDGVVYIGSADNNLYALNAANGSKRWHFKTNGIIRSKPIIADQYVVFGSFDGYIYAIDKDSGTELWKFKTGGAVTPSVAIYNNKVFIGSRDKNLYSLSLSTGEVSWKIPYENGSWVESGATIYNDTLYIGSSFLAKNFAINPGTGVIYWSIDAGGAAYATPKLTEEGYYSGAVGLENTNSGDFKGGVARYDRLTGDLVWRFKFSVVPGLYDHGVSSTVEVIDELVLFGALDGTFYALKEVEE